ncbi:MAG TPA: hypothetical protein ENI26_12800 [Methylophaga aminisulfidivorans]|uniref:DUF2607 family protein n=1 Tax=Methylophaga aminisulfidivorans TaxID=230105 RepID=A0A7C2AIZ0_9GAMM|nr:hypothetical protein [Methylophaga aminisulfidivorans]
MNHVRQKQTVLYALAAIVLLLQSFAVWHDAEHSFHHADAQCERLNAINHIPFATINADISILSVLKSVFIETDSSVPTLPATQLSHYSIRAPPVFS